MYRFIFKELDPVVRHETYRAAASGGKNYTNQKEAKKELAETARACNNSLRQLNSIFADAVNICQKHFFDLTPIQVQQYQRHLTNTLESIAHLTSKYVTEYLTARKIMQAADNLLLYLEFCKSNFTKIKYTGFQYSIDLQIENVKSIYKVLQKYVPHLNENTMRIAV